MMMSGLYLFPKLESDGQVHDEPHPYRRKKYGTAIPRLNSGSYSKRRIQQIVKEVAQSAGMEKRVSPHLLRHTMATRLVNGGIRKILGHESTDTAQMYAETEMSSLRDSLDAVSR